MKIPTYIINLKSRTDRRQHIEKEFAGRNEFKAILLEACSHKIGAVGLWQSLKEILSTAVECNLEYVLLCEDDHQFTENYNPELLSLCIEEAIKREAEVLCGGVSWFEDGFPVSENLFWAKKFSGFQFTILFKKLYAKILNSDFGPYDAADYKICTLAISKYFIHPFISTQKEFGYSDVTKENNGTKRVEKLFATTEGNATSINNISSFYKNNQNNKSHDKVGIDFDILTIPTYIINLPNRIERRSHIMNQFNEKKEFDITIIDACEHDIGAVGLWESIRKVIRMAFNNDDDAIIICEDDHEFTQDYTKELLLKNIIEAHEQGCDYLNCGTGKFDVAIPITLNRFWTNYCLSAQFIVLYRKFFQKILDEPYDDTVIADLVLSKMTRHKMILYPFISAQRDFGYSDVTPIHNEQKNLVQNMFILSNKRLNKIQHAYKTNLNY